MAEIAKIYNDDNNWDVMHENQIIKKCYLKDVNLDLIKKLEIDYF